MSNNRTASLAAYDYLKAQGIKTLLLTSTQEGETKAAGTLFSSIANEIVVSKNLLAAPAAIVVGGEITVKVTGRGLGGRNQVALSAALKLN